MPLNEGVYCRLEDLLKGDLDLPRYMGDGSQFVNRAAEDIDSHIGHIYSTPITVDTNDPRTRPTFLILKRINSLLASGRMMLDLAAAGETTELHAYGRSLVQEALSLLEKIANSEIVLYGAERNDPTPEDSTEFSGPAIKNADSYSLVQAFYERYNPNLGYDPVGTIGPYGG